MKLATMTNGLGLGVAYDATIRRIKSQEGDRARLGMDALMWISHAERPLSVDEICHALAVEIGSTDINTNNIPSIQTVLGCCQGLAAVDKESSTVRLIHFTLKEHFSRDTDLFDRSHSKIAETCLTYLNFQAITSIRPSLDYDPEHKILRYASLHWGTHIRMEVSDRARNLALDLLHQFDNHISRTLLRDSSNNFSIRKGKPFPPLHCASYFGSAEVAIDLIRTKRWDVNEQDDQGMTPLMWAARYGHEEVVKLLLEQKHTQPDMRGGQDGQTALSWASGSGHEGVVKLFLSQLFVNPGSIGRRRGTPQVMSLLFRRKYVNPDKPDNEGRTPLSQAAGSGHPGVVKLLLEREDVNPDRRDNDGRTPLSWTTGNLGVSRYPWVNEDEHEREGVVKLLLEREDVNPDRPDNDGQTPLSWAARNGSAGILKLLLEREDVNPDRPDNHGRTPLQWAAWCESEYYRKEVVKLLEARKAAAPSAV